MFGTWMGLFRRVQSSSIKSTPFMVGMLKIIPILRIQNFLFQIQLILLYTFHSGARDGWRMPLVFVLCTHKNTATYKTIFGQLKADQPQLKPKQINVDFEVAAIKAAKEAFPDAKIQGCFFHLLQSVVRNLAHNQLKQRYETNLQFATEIRQMTGIAFLPVEKVVTKFSPLLIFIY